MDKQSPRYLAAIISALSGPSIKPADIEWAADLPTGKKLLEWIAAQLLDEYIEDHERDDHSMTAATLRDIALEAGELDMYVSSLCYPSDSSQHSSLKHVGTIDVAPTIEEGPILGTIPGYFPPSRLK
jgi:hypothetical protein